MINHIGAMQTSSNIYATQAKLGTRPAGVPADAKEAFSIDLDKLFTPSERKTLENMKSYGEANSMSAQDVSMVEVSFVHSKLNDSLAPLSNEVIGNQIKATQDGHIDNTDNMLSVLKELYENFHLFQGVDLTT